MEHSFKYTHTLVTKKSDICGNFIGGFDRCASPLHLTMCMPMFIFNQVSRHVFTRSRSYFFRLIFVVLFYLLSRLNCWRWRPENRQWCNKHVRLGCVVWSRFSFVQFFWRTDSTLLMVGKNKTSSFIMHDDDNAREKKEKTETPWETTKNPREENALCM